MFKYSTIFIIVITLSVIILMGSENRRFIKVGERFALCDGIILHQLINDEEIYLPKKCDVVTPFQEYLEKQRITINRSL